MVATTGISAEPIYLDVSSLRLSDEQYFQLCAANPDLRIELTADRELIIMPPTGWGTGKKNSELNFQIQLWNRQARLGFVFESSTGFVLPDGTKCAPDVAWVLESRIQAIDPDPDKFLPLAPDFAIELRSASDNLNKLQQKMQNYRINGVRLGWLINPQTRQVEIYRIDTETVEVLENPQTLSGEDVLPGFVLDLTTIW